MRGYRVPSSLIDKIEREALHIGDFSYTDGMDKVIDAIKDLGEVELDNPWHTGTPTEDGEYLVVCQYVIDNYYYREKLVWEFENGDWKNKQRLTENYCIKDLKIIAWRGQKIEPYKENEDGHTD